MLLEKWQVGICTSTYEEYFLSGTIPDLCESHDFNTVSNKDVVQNRIQTEQDVIIEEPEPQTNIVETPLPQEPETNTDLQNNQEAEEQDFSSQDTNNKPTENAVTNNVNTGNSLDTVTNEETSLPPPQNQTSNTVSNENSGQTDETTGIEDEEGLNNNVVN